MNLTCVDGTRVMVAEGAAFAVTAQRGACLLAVGTFLEGKGQRSVVSAQSSDPSPHSELIPPPHIHGARWRVKTAGWKILGDAADKFLRSAKGHLGVSYPPAGWPGPGSLLTGVLSY